MVPKKIGPVSGTIIWIWNLNSFLFVCVELKYMVFVTVLIMVGLMLSGLMTWDIRCIPTVTASISRLTWPSMSIKFGSPSRISTMVEITACAKFYRCAINFQLAAQFIVFSFDISSTWSCCRQRDPQFMERSHSVTTVCNRSWPRSSISQLAFICFIWTVFTLYIFGLVLCFFIDNVIISVRWYMWGFETASIINYITSNRLLGYHLSG